MTTVKSTIHISQDIMNEVKALVALNVLSSITEATNEGLSLLLKEKRKEAYALEMKEASKDADFMQRTLSTHEEFDKIDHEVMGEW